VAAPAPGVEFGLASWYGLPYHGRPAASGQIYDMEQLTAAHRTLPFGTLVRVRNLANERTVDVRINDRGPFAEGRIIDLSYAAARAIGLVGPGTIRVSLQVIAAPAVPVSGTYAVQVGAFRDRSNAERLRRQMEQRYGMARTILRQGDPPLWRVLVGAQPTLDGAKTLAGQLRGAGAEVFVVRVDSDRPADRI